MNRKQLVSPPSSDGWEGAARRPGFVRQFDRYLAGKECRDINVIQHACQGRRRWRDLGSFSRYPCQHQHNSSPASPCSILHPGFNPHSRYKHLLNQCLCHRPIFYRLDYFVIKLGQRLDHLFLSHPRLFPYFGSLPLSAGPTKSGPRFVLYKLNPEHHYPRCRPKASAIRISPIIISGVKSNFTLCK